MTCQACGHPLELTDRICPRCGKAVAGVVSAGTQPHRVTQPLPDQEPSAAPTPNDVVPAAGPTTAPRASAPARAPNEGTAPVPSAPFPPPRPSAGPPTAVSARGQRPEREEKTINPVRVKDVLSARYRLDDKIGEGGMGTVFLAFDLELDRQVAVKMLAPQLVNDPEVVERFEREAKLTAKLDHPNIVPIYDVGRHENRPFIVMKLLQGDTLAGLLRDKGGLTSDDTAKLMRQLAAGLDYIHSRGFIHRDIKAGNIFVGHDGHATILDFGILRSRSASQGLTRTGMVMGTPHYMAPEQAMGLRDVDHRVDLYALAVVLFECLTGTLPFEADSELRLIQMQAHEPPPDIVDRAPWIAKPVAEVVRRALAKRPDDRFSSAAELVRALEGAYRESGGHQAAPRQMVAAGNWTSGPLGPQSPTPSQAPSAGLKLAELPVSNSVPVVPGVPLTGEHPPTRGRAPLVALALLVAGVGIAAAVLRPWQTTAVTSSTVDAGHELAMQPDASTSPFAALPPDDGGALASATLDAGGDESPEVDGGAQTAVVVVEPVFDGGRRVSNPPYLVKRHGSLRVITMHGGETCWATVSLDGVQKGVTPINLDLAPGRYQLSVARAGFRPESRDVRVAAGKSSVVRIDLTP